ncbi:MAG TPA: hypothetical protein VFH18_01820 [Erysipelotrichaceae bacterium]|nr:hypothetical protein [Erysipelotrichaceae bacterium]
MKQSLSKSELFNELKTRFGFKNNGSIAYAEINGYGYSLNRATKNYFQLATSVNFNDVDKKKSVIDGLTNLKNKVDIDNTIEGNHRIFILIKTPCTSELFMSELTIILNSLGTLFMELDLKPSCWNCNKEGKFHVFQKGRSTIEVCDECVEQLNHYHTVVQYNLKMNSSYLTGFIGAFLGASLGGVLWLMISMMGFYTSLVGIAMGYLSYNGYLLFKGNRGKYMMWILLTSVVLVIILTSVLETSYYLYKDPEYSFTVIESISLGFRSLYDTQYFYVDMVWKNIAMALVFAVMGCFRYLITAANNSKILNNEPLTEFVLGSE